MLSDDAHHERLSLPSPQIAGVSGVILAGGKSLRMGRDKSLLPCKGKPLIETVFKVMAELFADVVVVIGRPDDDDFLPCLKITDIDVGKGSMAGVHAGLEPLHAFYSRDALPLLEAALNSEQVRLIDILHQLGAKIVPAAEIAGISADGRSFVNLNTPDDYSLLD